MELIRVFNKLNKNDAGIAGGKGASLGEMTQAGIPVPPGFVVLSESFEQFLKETDLVQEIDAILHKVKHNEIHTVEAASEQIRALILNAEMPADIAGEIDRSFKELNTKYVAVRSSATAEDGMDHAWAGQLESYLNTTQDDVLTKVKLCWSSLFTPRAIFYRFEKGLHSTKISVAVVVQKMVESEISGIAFSVHPVTEDHNQLIIEAGFGLGEAIVSGSITPDSYVVEKDPRNILDINVSTQDRGLYRSEKNTKEHGNNEWVSIPEPKASSQVLTEAQILELSEIILKIENHYDFPCDIEWAYEAGKFYIVQSRPITTLTTKKEDNFNLPFKREDYSFSGLWKCNLFADWFWTTWLVPELAKKVDLDLQDGGILVITGGNFFVKHSTLAAVKNYIQQILSKNDEATLKKLTEMADSVYKTSLDRLEELKKQEVSSDVVKEVSLLGQQIMFPWCLGYIMSEAFDEFLIAGATSAGINPENISSLLPHFVTPLTESQNEQRDLKKMLKAKGYWQLLLEDSSKAIEAIKADARVLQVIEAYRMKYGWLPVLNLIDEKLTTESILVQLTGLKEESHRESHEIPAEMVFLMKVASTTAYLRQTGVEYFSIYSYRAIPVFQEAAQKIGITYIELLDLHLDEILSGFDGANLKSISAKRAGDVWAISSGPNATASVIDDPEIVQALAKKMVPKATENSNEIKGQIGNKGKATGRAKVVLVSQEFSKIEDGDILVTTMTTPDFVPMMQKAAAIVTDIGGLLCHAAIISREMNKPCVIGTKFATQILKDGDMVEVDANTGVVRIIEALKKDTPNPSDYIRMFAGKSFLYIYSDVFLQHYGPLGVVVVQDETGWMSFFPKSMQEQTLKEGKELYTSKELYEKYSTDFHEYMQSSSKYFKSVLDKPRIEAEEVKEFLQLAGKHFSFYSKTEFFYTDSIDQKNMALTVQEFDKLKLDGRSYLNNVFFENDGAIQSFAKKISEQTGVPAKDLLRYNISELEDLVRSGKKLDESLVKDRDIFFDSQKLKLFGVEAKKLVAEFLFEYRHVSNLIKGITANKGKAKGKARVLIPDFGDFSKIAAMVEEMQEGEILIAETTAPEIIKACKKAAAIVTNQGGMLSHAAIISRELGIPCVVGTDKDVTLNIKTGDDVEVDADKGIVTIL